MACAMASRCARLRGPVAKRSHTPPPKSAPARSAYAITAKSARAAARTSRGMRGLGGRGRARGEPAKRGDEDDGEEEGNETEGEERGRDVARRGHRGARAK